MGEGWHNYHHSFPWDYRASEFHYRVNLTTLWIEVFAWLGWAHDLKTPSEELVRRTVEKLGDGSHFRWGRGVVEEEERWWFIFGGCERQYYITILLVLFCCLVLPTVSTYVLGGGLIWLSSRFYFSYIPELINTTKRCCRFSKNQENPGVIFCNDLQNNFWILLIIQVGLHKKVFSENFRTSVVYRSLNLPKNVLMHFLIIQGTLSINYYVFQVYVHH